MHQNQVGQNLHLVQKSFQKYIILTYSDQILKPNPNFKGKMLCALDLGKHNYKPYLDIWCNKIVQGNKTAKYSGK